MVVFKVFRGDPSLSPSPNLTYNFIYPLCPIDIVSTLALFRLQQFASNLLKCNVASVPCASNC